MGSIKHHLDSPGKYSATDVNSPAPGQTVVLFEGEELLPRVYNLPVLDRKPTRLVPGLGDAGGGCGGRLGGKRAIQLQATAGFSQLPGSRQHKGRVSNLCQEKYGLWQTTFIVKSQNLF